MSGSHMIADFLWCMLLLYLSRAAGRVVRG
uniref:Uncharacterized protein n=1 Tax=Moniliophthora roreri TaxID=221103 RepID=A0A0W0FK52_MONRR